LDDDNDDVYHLEELPPSFIVDYSAGLDGLVGNADEMYAGVKQK
jgi:hypothetical protein